MINQPTSAYPFVSLTIDIPLLLEIEKHLHEQACEYGLGAKAPSLTCDTSEIHSVDCSGFVRYALARAAHVDISDGSVQQHEWIESHGFKRSTVADGKDMDGAVRIAFLTPADGGGVGHVVLIYSGLTLESHGSVGPDRRQWNTNLYPWMSRCQVYVLSPPNPPVSG